MLVSNMAASRGPLGSDVSGSVGAGAGGALGGLAFTGGAATGAVIVAMQFDL
jgi:hypothetical protein